ncbi:MAG TPA: VOC family protein [Planctomycetota bacterium]|nr:VOC family protein [Planctomycetota bacterium]
MPRSKAAKTKRPAPKKAPAAKKVILGVQDVYYNVEDMDRAVRFYRDVLEFKVHDTNEWWSSLEIGGLRVGLHGMGGQKVPHVSRDDHGAHAGATLTLRVADIDQAHAALASKGVNFLGPIQRDEWGSVVAFEDTEGNVLKLMQPPR